MRFTGLRQISVKTSYVACENRGAIVSQDSDNVSSRIRKLTEEAVGPMEALASMAEPEDASQLEFGLGFQKERNQEVANLAARFVVATSLIQQHKNALINGLAEAVDNPSNSQFENGERKTT